MSVPRPRCHVWGFGRSRAAQARLAVLTAGAVGGALLGSVAVAPPAAAALPAFLGTLAGPSLGAMYPSGEQYDAVNNRIVVADTGRDLVLI